MSDREKEETYRKFRDYVETELRDEENPELTVTPLDEMKEPGTVYLELELVGVRQATRLTRWIGLVKNFRKGSRLESETKTFDKSLVFVCYIPFIDLDRPRKQKTTTNTTVTSRNTRFIAYDPFPLILWSFVLLLVLVVSGFKISPEEWRYVFHFFD